MSTPFDQCVSSFWSGCLHLLISKWHWLQKPKFGHLHLLILCLCLHLLFSKFDQGVSTFWSASDTDFKNLSLGIYTFWSCVSAFWSGRLHLLISTWHWLQKSMFGCLHLLIRVSLPFDQQVTLTSKTYCSNFHWVVRGHLHLLISKWHLTSRGVVSAFWSASDTESKTPVPTLDVVVSLPWQRIASAAFRSCLHLGREHLLQLLKMSPPFDQQVTLTSKT